MEELKLKSILQNARYIRDSEKRLIAKLYGVFTAVYCEEMRQIRIENKKQSRKKLIR